MLNVEKVESFLIEALARLRAVTPATLHSWRPLKLSKQEDRITGWSPGTKPDFSLYMANVLFAMPLYDEITVDIKNETHFGALAAEYSKRHNSQVTSLSSALQVADLLRQYLASVPTLIDDRRLIHEMSTAFVESLEQKGTCAIYYGVLRGVFGETDLVELSADLSIHRMTDEEIERFLSARQNPYSLVVEADGAPNNRYVAEYKMTVPHELGEFPAQAQDAINACVASLRLLKSASVEIESIYARPVHPGAIRSRLRMYQPRHRRASFSNTYELNKAEVDELIKTFGELTHLRNAKRTRTAINRLNISSERVRPEDQLIDAVISLEAIYGDGGGASTYKIAVRCAAHLGAAFEERWEIKKVVESIYRERSSLVHGGGVSGQRLAELAATATNLARRALKKLGANAVLNGTTPSPEDFDTLLLGTSSSVTPLFPLQNDTHGME